MDASAFSFFLSKRKHQIADCQIKNAKPKRAKNCCPAWLPAQKSFTVQNVRQATLYKIAIAHLPLS
jgi:hypothetical protein